MNTITEAVDTMLRRTRDLFIAVPLPYSGADDRIELAAFLRAQGWPSAPITAHAVALFAGAVRRRYEAERGHQPPWDRGWLYEGVEDLLLIRDTYHEEIGAIAEQLAFEGARP